MARTINTLEQAAKLRQQAEELALRHPPPASAASESTLPDWATRMLHELRVHQIELEMQNEELRRAQIKLTDANARYSDLYNSAPIGLFTLNDSGVIIDANLYAASRLGMSIVALVRQPFTRFIPRKEQDDFYRRRRKVTNATSTESWELRMVRYDGIEFWAHLGAVADQDADGSPVLRITMGDISVQENPENQKGLHETEARSARRTMSLGDEAHELSNVLGGILGMASVNLATEPVGSLSHQAYETITETTERGATTVPNPVRPAQQQLAVGEAQDPIMISPEASGQRKRPIPDTLQPGAALPDGLSLPSGVGSPHATSDKTAPSTEAGRLTNIRKAVISDIPGVVEVHLASFQNFFLTFLGRAFLVHLYHEVVLEPNAVFLVATVSPNVVVGFAAGVPNLSAFYERLARDNWLKFGLASIRAAIRRPSIVPRLYRSLRASEFANEAACSATLMSIAVAPGIKRRGLGKGLISRFLGEMGAAGVQAVCLTTDRDKNDPTIGFYEQLGFMRVREFQTKEGRWICEYLIHPQEFSLQSHGY